jgi:hypothetical protein
MAGRKEQVQGASSRAWSSGSYTTMRAAATTSHTRTPNIEFLQGFDRGF